MAANETSYVKAQRNMQGFMAVLTSAACEWFLIFLLLIDAVFSFIVTKFAGYCKLPLPCILCSRLDHILGNERPEFYRNLLCSNHRSEISSLISCHIHGKLAAGSAMCDDCLLSFSPENNSNLAIDRLFLGKLGFDLVGCSSQSSLATGDFIPLSKSKGFCSCCNKPWKSRQNLQRLLELKSPGTRATKLNIPLPCSLSNQDGLKKIRDTFSGQSVASHRVVKSNSDSLSQKQYGELKITSDSESAFPFSNDNDHSSVIRDINEANDHASKPHDIECLTYDVSCWHDMTGLNWRQPHQKSYSSPLPELIALDDISPISNTLEAPTGVSVICPSANTSAIADPMSVVDFDASSEVVEVPIQASTEKANITSTTNTQHASINHHEEILKLLYTTAGLGTKNVQFLNSPAPAFVNPTCEDPTIKMAVSGKGRELAGFVFEKSIEKEHDRDTQDLKLPSAQKSSAQGIDLPRNNTSTSVQESGDELQITDASSSNGIQIFQKSIWVERSESAGLEYLDGSTVSEIEGECTIDRLRRQVEYDRRCMNILYKELHEERSASAVAANEAMAMITRLQEEKANLNMDALQYLRMMEEQAEYDLEALEKANGLLAEKEKEIQDLESQLEYYRLKYPDESVMETILKKNYDPEKGNMVEENMMLDSNKHNANFLCNSMDPEISKDIDKPDTDSSPWSEIEDEKLYILQFLNGLERKLQLFAREGLVHEISDGAYSQAAAGVDNQGKLLGKDGNSINCWTEKKGLSLEKDLPVSNGSISAHEGLNASIGGDQFVGKENILVPNGEKDLTNGRKNYLVVLENEISELRDRLEALKDDCNFLDHAFNFLQKGTEGLSFIREIARQLQDIRKIGMQSTCRSVS